MWKDIWEKKGKDIDYSNLSLSDLISIDGFDSSGKNRLRPGHKSHGALSYGSSDFHGSRVRNGFS